MLEPERDRVASAARSLAAEGLVLGTAGNVSVRAGDLVAVSATGARLAALAPEHVAIVDLDGRHCHGSLRATSELDLHLEIYRRYEAAAIIHTHSPFATALACVLDELPVVHYGLLALGGPIRVAPYATFGTRKLAQATAAALHGRSAVLMANHGTIAVGADLEAALDNSRLLEWVAGVYILAASVGRPRILDAEQCADVTRAVAERAYGAPRRITMDPDPVQDDGR